MADIVQTMVGEARDTLLAAQRHVNEIKQQRAEELQTRLDALLAKMKSLQEEELVLAKMPVQRKEFLEIAKDQLRDMRTDALGEMLLPHLQECQENNTPPLQPAALKLTVMAEKNLWRLFYVGLTEKDLKKLVNSLPDIGISDFDRNDRLAGVTAEIKKINDILKTEYSVSTTPQEDAK